MGDFLIENWEKLVVIIGAIVGLWKYHDSRNRELSWKRTEFIFEQARLLDTDTDISEAIKILEGRHPVIKLSDIFDGVGSLSSNEQCKNEYLHKFDKFLNLLDRVAYAVLDARTLTKKEVANLQWYVEKIVSHPNLMTYCNKAGFTDILRMARILGWS